MNALQIIHELTPPVAWKAAKAIARSLGWRRGAGPATGCMQGSDYYDSIYDKSDEYRKHYSQSRYYFLWCVLLDRIKPNRDNFVLDVGCGPGQLAALLRDNGLGRYVGLDFSETTVRLATAACPEFKFVRADAFITDLFESLPYDIVVCTEFLEHVENDIQLLDRIRPGTRVYGSVPNFADAGHVRYFGNGDEVRGRYAGCFETIQVASFLAEPAGRRYFLFEGIRGDRQVHPRSLYLEWCKERSLRIKKFSS